MPAKSIPLPCPRCPRHKPVEVAAFLAARPLSNGELKRVSRVHAAEGIGDMRRPASFSPNDDADAVAATGERAVPALIVVSKTGRSSLPCPSLFAMLGGDRALDALRHDKVDCMLALAENVATGALV